MIIMKFILCTICILLFVSPSVRSEEDEDVEDPEEESKRGREVRQYTQEWRTIEYFHNQDWLPDDDATFEPPTPAPKRRRIRKRKRRPTTPFPIDVDEDDVDTSDDDEEHRRHIRPLDEFHESWDAFDHDDFDRRPNVRRKSTPSYRTEKIRDPFTALQEAEERQKISPQDDGLKALLKKSSDVSLSEVLQKKNVTLGELLTGDKKAISLLTESTTKPTTPKRTYGDGVNSREALEAQRKRLAVLHNHKNNKLYSELKKMEVINEPTTEKRVFIPSNLRTSLEPPELTTLTPSTTSKKLLTRMTFKPKQKSNLPITSAKLNHRHIKTTTENYPKIPPKAIQIDVKEIFANVKRNESDAPFKMTINLDELMENATETTTISTGKLHEVTAKDEINEVLKDPNSRDNLSRILRLRNMTIEELVAQRERGSSQLHLADIFHNETKEPEPADEPLIGQFFSSLPKFDERKPKSLKSNETKKETYTVTSFPTYKIESTKQMGQKESAFPIWKSLYPELFVDGTKIESVTESSAVRIDDLQRLDEVENRLAEAARNQLDIDLLQDYDDDGGTFQLPSSVRSAMIASSAIVGLSLFVFMTILVIFRWSQRRRRKHAAGSRIRLPILEGSQKRTLRTFVNETLGRRKKYYKTQNMQSMSDSIWHTDKKPYF